MDAKEIQEKIDILQKEVSTVIKGKDEVIRKVIMAILASGHVLLEDVPGLGKTTLAKAFSKALGFACQFIMSRQMLLNMLREQQ